MTAFWLIAFIALVAGEAVTVGLVCIWFAAGAVGGFLVAVLGGQFWFQLIVFAAVSALTLALVRPAASRFVHPRRSPTNADRVVNQTAAVTETIDNEAQVRSMCWARSGPPAVSWAWSSPPEPR